MNNNELYHYGIPGMRWGVRKSQKRMSSDAEEVRSLKKKKVKEMSNDEIRKVHTRQKLEKQHKELNPGAIAKGLIIAGAVAAALTTINNLYRNSRETIKNGKEIADQYKTSKLKKKHAAQIKAFGKDAVIKRSDLKVSKIRQNFKWPKVKKGQTLVGTRRK